MTGAAAFSGLLRAPTAVFNPADTRHPPGERWTDVRERVINRVAAMSRLLRISGRPVAVNLDCRLDSVLAVNMALADAVRQQLMEPGSIGPQRQLQLMIADRAVHDALGSAAPAPSNSGWTPFLENVETRPYRPIAGIGWALSDQTGKKDVWWDSPAEEFMNP